MSLPALPKVSFSCLTSPICPIITQNHMKHDKLQEVKVPPNLASDFACLDTLKLKPKASHVLLLEIWEGEKK